jgi:hypothetical protein
MPVLLQVLFLAKRRLMEEYFFVKTSKKDTKASDISDWNFNTVSV